MIVAALVVAMIAVSVTAFIVQTLPEYVFSGDPAWAAVEYACIAVFTLEFALRIGTCPSVWAFLKCAFAAAARSAGARSGLSGGWARERGGSRGAARHTRAALDAQVADTVP